MRGHLAQYKPDCEFPRENYLLVSSADGMIVTLSKGGHLEVMHIDGINALIKIAHKQKCFRKIDVPFRIVSRLGRFNELTQGMREAVEVEIIQYFKEHDNIYIFLSYGIDKLLDDDSEGAE